MAAMDWGQSKPLRGVRALLATEKQLTKELIVTALKGAGAGQTITGTAGEMLDTVRNFDPDVIFSDYDMSPLDGNAFVRHVRTEFRLKTPSILLFHTEDQDDALLGAKQAGLNGALPIPFTQDAVIKMTRRVLGLAG